MSILFKGRAKGASSSKVSVLQAFVMFFVSHVRQALSSLGELWRQPLASLMTIGVLGLSITLPSTLYIMVKNTEKITAGWEQASEISLFLTPNISANRSQQLVTRLNTWQEIESVVYIPADDALKEFQHLSGLGDAIAYLEKNPLPDVVLVTPTDKNASPSAARALLDKLRQQREVDIGKLDIEWLERLYAVIAIASDLVMLIGVLLFIAVVLIIGNTIRLNILNKYDEIVVMKLVGATDAFIHRPFLYTGFWYGLLGGLMAWFAVIIILWWMDSSITTFAAMYQKEFNITGLTGSALLTMLGLSVLLGLLGSLISVQRHVRQIEPQ
ncbi:cell division protein FtsX [Alteromonas genovensis]|jgi:cell division transport system permease protein|uniref:Cell division protein FtsX n=2 Tax=Alteromonas TaxID=226 RepID=A0A6N9TG96_9ALTE|nr:MULTISPECIES: permease-like cell division protein FtsX [Alteromonas]MAI38095.1 cell division protein FtsX [Alteromonas sp.]NDW16151.1 cell division protein FtsX [Alteromonas genovensis]OUX86531.1 MAG: cell division protein FtsX [Alteromonas sp. TMED35]|tara:strand:+ start:31312 stop:32292 length:981 start_codon:yes stop_codon:yes gene_type:complete